MNENKFSKILLSKLIDIVDFNEVTSLVESIKVFTDCVYSDLIESEIVQINENNGFLDMIESLDVNKSYKVNKIVKVYLDKFLDKSNKTIDRSASRGELGIDDLDIKKAQVCLDSAKKLYYLLSVLDRKATAYSNTAFESIDNLEFEVNMDLDDDNENGDSKNVTSIGDFVVSKGRWLFELSGFDKKELSKDYNYQTHEHVYAKGNEKSIVDKNIYELLEDYCDTSDLLSLTKDVKLNKYTSLEEISDDFKDIHIDYTHIIRCSMDYPFMIKLEKK